jgi:hypothetical protein
MLVTEAKAKAVLALVPWAWQQENGSILLAVRSTMEPRQIQLSSIVNGKTARERSKAVLALVPWEA